MTEDQIKHVVNRFLSWKLPENFSPDCGITFKKMHSEQGPYGAQRYEPVGTNLFDATQTDAMVRYMLEGLPSDGNPSTDFAWVIEKGSGSDMKYYAPTAPGEWSKDHLKACRFARKEDAEAIQFRHVTHGRLAEYDTRVCEHGWG